MEDSDTPVVIILLLCLLPLTGYFSYEYGKYKEREIWKEATKAEIEQVCNECIGAYQEEMKKVQF